MTSLIYFLAVFSIHDLCYLSPFFPSKIWTLVKSHFADEAVRPVVLILAVAHLFVCLCV